MTAKPPEAMTEAELAADNIKKMFRVTMASNARKEGETVEQLQARIAADPGTAKVAAMLHTTVEDLMDGFGNTEQLHVREGYNHAAAVAEVSQIMERVAQEPGSALDGELARDGAGKSGTQLGALAAPKQGDRKSAIVTQDAASAALLRNNLQQVRSMGGAPGKAAGDDEDDEPPRGKNTPKKRGMTARFRK